MHFLFISRVCNVYASIQETFLKIRSKLLQSYRETKSDLESCLSVKLIKHIKQL